MNWAYWLPLLILFSSLGTGIAIFFLDEDQVLVRTVLNLAGAVVKLLLTVLVFVGMLTGVAYETRLPIVPGFELLLRVDAISILFMSLSAVLWLVTTVYAVGYLEGSPYRSRFFGFFSLCVTATMGIALAGNLLTFFIFYEMLTLATYPLVVHRGTRSALLAGRNYLFYTLTGGALFLAGIIWLKLLTGETDFAVGGILSDFVDSHAWSLRVMFVLMMAGLGVKAALVPLHGWLPQAMVAPAPVSALLHAVAVVKAGAYGIVRVVYEIFSTPVAYELGLLGPLAVLASVTIVYGSVRALMQDDLKRRLAFSTVSQLAYITLGTAIVGPLASVGALVHLVHQGLMKITLFFCAGNFAETLHVHKVSEMHGIGRRMPWTMAAFTVGALGMIGLPPMAGFVSKWYLGLGALAAEQGWVVGVLIVSSLLNAMYFLPIVHVAWFRSPAGPWDERMPEARWETRMMLLAPAVTTALLSVAAGVFAASPISPLAVAEIIAGRLYEGL
ncbi:complex I subunit 5 family protein [Phycisphaerales bacterium AB-hyl4]|uniref:Complex I subunit 5 family protein n=1 Tax=Natronomicrosphaera hydrolytica TaxID=3242702 RepID=A0ABV4U7T3_9BACT